MAHGFGDGSVPRGNSAAGRGARYALRPRRTCRPQMPPQWRDAPPASTRPRRFLILRLVDLVGMIEAVGAFELDRLQVEGGDVALAPLRLGNERLDRGVDQRIALGIALADHLVVGLAGF